MAVPPRPAFFNIREDFDYGYGSECKGRLHPRPDDRHGFDADSKNGKVIAAMMDLLEEMAAQVTEHDNALDQVYDELETLDQDLDDVVSDIYADEDEDDEEDAEDDSTM